VPRSGLARALRPIRRLWFQLRAEGVPAVYHRDYQRNVWGVPLDPLRGEKVLAALENAGLLPEDALSEPRPASLENLLRVHTAEYLQSLQDGAGLTRILGVEVPGSEAEKTLDLQRLMVGGTIQATRLALQTGGAVAHLGGGFHHASAAQGSGFCVFNDVAVAIARLRARGYGEPILVVDLDLHDGDGTRAVFATDASVHTYSVHNEHRGETGAVASTAIAMGPGVDDQAYLATLRATLPPVVASFRPRLVVYVAGTDGAADDAIGNWKLSEAGLRERDRFVVALARPEGQPRPLVVVLGGGYGPRAWRHTARFLLWLASGRDLEPLSEEELVLKRFRRLGRAVAPEDDGLPFSISAEDLAAIQPGLRASPRFLGDLSRNGVELLLERSGILAQLRAKGFRSLRVEIQAPEGGGHTLRILSLEQPGELLVEVRLSRSRNAIPGMEVIALEWLLLQNPRERFTERRSRLPGQKHPGLGLLRDIVGWLFVVCESHELDGIYFVAAHYHVAMQSRRVLRFWKPEDEARTRALSAALEGLTLAEATSALSSGKVIDQATGRPAVWPPTEMVLPVSPRLQAAVEGPERERRVAETLARFRFRPLSPVSDR
jgi:acetoin utilization deacetylase AcuC-like enzyme